MKKQPVVFTWSGAAMVPLPRYLKVAERQFVVGEEYPMELIEERSQASHNAYFAALHDGFQNLPEKIAARFPTEMHLRRWLLIETNWFDEKEFDMLSEQKARELALWVRTEEEYARIHVHGTKVIVRRAKSQSRAAMGKADFEASKRACLDLLEAMTDVPKGSLMKNAGRAA
jgi:hypothetical protein